MKWLGLLGERFGHLCYTGFAPSLRAASRRLPPSLLRFNEAFVLSTLATEMKVPPSMDPDIVVRIATLSDLDSIVRISGWDTQRAIDQLQSNAVCFMASAGASGPAALTWLAFGSCYIRGMAFHHDFPPGDMYGFGTICLPEFRGRGLYLALNAAVVKYARENGLGRIWVLVESTNERSLSLRGRLGFVPQLRVGFVSLLGLRSCHVHDLHGGGSSSRFVIRQPSGNVTVV